MIKRKICLPIFVLGMLLSPHKFTSATAHNSPEQGHVRKGTVTVNIVVTPPEQGHLSDLSYMDEYEIKINPILVPVNGNQREVYNPNATPIFKSEVDTYKAVFDTIPFNTSYELEVYMRRFSRVKLILNKSALSEESTFAVTLKPSVSKFTIVASLKESAAQSENYGVYCAHECRFMENVNTSSPFFLGLSAGPSKEFYFWSSGIGWLRLEKQVGGEILKTKPMRFQNKTQDKHKHIYKYRPPFKKISIEPVQQSGGQNNEH